ncbi:MAG: NnrU family protein [Woeseiaceae bacterium]|nr:NnrU family protein [Woeseiaceae bacterium]
MALLAAGMTLWIVVHLFPAYSPGSRDTLVGRLGENPYKGVFSLLSLIALVLIVFGWKRAVPQALYAPPLMPGIVPAFLVLVGLILFFASQLGGYLKRTLRHPQMLGTILWAGAHLLTNGDTRSVTLFGGMAAWALLEIVLCNRRDGPRHELPQASIKADVLAVVVGVAVFGLVGHFHMTLFGVAPLPI